MHSGVDVSFGLKRFVGGDNASHNSGKKKTENSVLIFFKQIYYTIAMAESHCFADNILQDDIDLESLQGEIGNDNPLCIISSVDYGRIIIAKATSTESFETMTKKLNANFSFFAISSSASVKNITASERFRLRSKQILFSKVRY